MNLRDGNSSIELNGIEVELNVRGRGRPLLFLHPEIGLDRAEPALDRLAQGALVIAPTHPHFGRPKVPSEFNSIDDLAYLYLDLLDALDLRDVAVVGPGLGGWIAAEIAVKNAARLSHLVLVDAFGVKIGDRDTRDIFDMYFITDAELQKVLYVDQELAKRDLTKLPDEQLYAIARAREATSRYAWRPYFHNPKLKGRLHRVRTPTLFLWGTEDRIVTPEYGRAYCARFPDARFQLIERAGHFPHVERPDEVARLALNFIEGR